MIDKANFYKLPKEEQDKKLKDLWVDSSKDVRQFAKNLAEEIKNEDTPFVLGVDGGYGTGKTYFSTRFTEYLKEKGLNAIYNTPTVSVGIYRLQKKFLRLLIPSRILNLIDKMDLSIKSSCILIRRYEERSKSKEKQWQKQIKKNRGYIAQLMKQNYR